MLMLALVSAAIWTYLLAFHGRFWAVAEPPAPPALDNETRRVVAVIPARNEAEAIGATIASLLAQDHVPPLEIVLVDDHSEDGTADVAREAAGGSDRLTILAAKPLPPDWTGKLWAVSQGIAVAAERAPDYFLLTDADIVHDRSNVATLVRRAEAERLDLASLMVRLHCRSFAERSLIPAFVFFFFMLYPPRWAADPRRSLAAAAGGCMLVRPEAMARIGGIQAIRGALIDDCSLAAAIKGSGGRIRLDATRLTGSNRAYEGFGEIWRMIARTAFTQLRYSSLLLAGTLLGLAVTYLAPPLLAVFGTGLARWLGLGAWLAMAAAFLPTVRLYRLNPLWALSLPAVAVFYAAATFGSAMDYWRGKGGQWKGRAQAIRARS